MEANEQAYSQAPTMPTRFVPSVVWGAVFAALVAGGFVAQGYYQMNHPDGGCDGGTCVVAFLLGIVKGIAALVLGVPIGL